MAVSPETINRIKALPVSEILEKEGVFLKRIGREFLTHCLWHNDKNPSLTISDDKGFVFCHVCQHHDDTLGFIQKKYGLTFREACERVASKNGLSVLLVDEDDSVNKKINQEIAEQIEFNEKTQQVYKANLKKYKEPIEFIKSRNIKPETSRFFGLGYNSSEKRVTIPIHDYKGRLVGFTGRTISNDVKPKYKNTENNIVFNKSELVYNEFRASDEIRRMGSCVFVEGHLDVISLHQSGYKNIVALQGTSTPSHAIIKRLLRKTNTFVLCMDSDAGGRLAVSKFLESVQSFTLSGQVEVKIVTLPPGKDPDEFTAGGGDFGELIGNAPSWLDWILDDWLDELDFNDKIKIQNVELQIKNLFSKITSPALRAHYYDKAAIRLAQNKQAVAAEILKDFQSVKPPKLKIKTWQRPGPEFTKRVAERRALRSYIHCPEFRWVLRPLMDYLTFPESIWLWRRIDELEQYSEDLDPYHLMAILVVSENQYIERLRPLLKPTIEINCDPMAVSHTEEILCMNLPADTAEA